MKMHSPGQASAASITACDVADGTEASEPEPPGSLSGTPCLADVGDAVLELHEHVGAVVDAQPVAGAQVLVDPHPHAAARHGGGRRAHPRARPTARGESTGAHVPLAPVHEHRTALPAPIARLARTSGNDRPASSRTRGRGCSTATTPRRSPISRPRTRTPESSSPSRTRELVETIYEEIKSRVQETDLSVPVRHGVVVRHPNRWRAWRTPCSAAVATPRSPTPRLGDARLQTAKAEGRYEYFDVHTVDVVARPHPAGVVERHRRQREVHARVRDLGTGEELPDEIPGTTSWAGTAWSADGALPLLFASR